MLAHEILSLVRNTHHRTRDLPASWKLVKSWEFSSVRPALYQRGNEPWLVLVFPGTDAFNDSINWRQILDDASLMFRKLPSGLPQAFQVDAEIRQQYRDYPIVYAGYSLGAVYAELMALLHRGTALSFDGPGIAPLLMTAREQGYNLDEHVDSTKILRFSAAPNVINTALTHVLGQRTTHLRLQLPHDGAATVYRALMGSLYRLFHYAHPTTAVATAILQKLLSPALYFSWLWHQHSIDVMERELTRQNVAERVVMWPQLSLHYPELIAVGGSGRNALRLFNPDNPGLHTIADLQSVFERRVHSLENFVAEGILDVTAHLERYLDEPRRLGLMQSMIEMSHAPLDACVTGSITQAVIPYAYAAEQRMQRSLVLYNVAGKVSVSDSRMNDAGVSLKQEVSIPETAEEFRPSREDVERWQLVISDPSPASTSVSVRPSEAPLAILPVSEAEEEAQQSAMGFK
jgi:hypothetical protein